MILRKYRRSDADIIAGWVTDEIAMYEWSADRISKFPFNGEDLHAHHIHTMQTERFTPYTFTEDDGTVVGHIAIRYPDETDESMVRFGFVITDPARRRRGYGRAMLEAASDYSRDVLRAQRVTLSVFTRNTTAIRFYGSVGFRASGEPENYRLPIGDWEGVILEKPLI